MPKMKTPKMSAKEAKNILVDVLINAMNNAHDLRDVIDLWDEDEAKDLASALRVMGCPTLATKVKKQLC